MYLNCPADVSSSSLHRAVVNGDLKLVNRLLAEGANVNALTGGDSPLNLAVMGGHIEVVRVLIEHDSDIECRDFVSLSPLHCAAKHGHLEIVNILIDKGADVNAAPFYGDTPLDLAVEGGHVDVIKVLIQHGSDCKRHIRWKESLLQWAAKHGYVEIVNLLIDKGADVKAAPHYGDTPLQLAVERGHIDVIRVLIERGSDIEWRNCQGYSSLHWAAKHGHLDIVNLLIDKGADVNAVTQCVDSTLTLAVENSHIDVVRVLIQHGSDIERRNRWNESLLRWAAKHGHLEIVNILIDKGADVNAAPQYGGTPLQLAVERGHIEVVRLLIEHGSDIDCCNWQGYSSLHLAAEHGHLEIVNILIDKGADVNAAPQYGGTPLQLAVERGHVEVVRLLIEHGSDIDCCNWQGYSSLHLAAKHGHLDIVNILIDKGANINFVTKHKGDTPFHFALRGAHTEVVRVLIEHGSDISYYNHRYYSPLHCAAEHGHWEIVNRLIQKAGTNINGITSITLVLAELRHYTRIVKELNDCSLYESLGSRICLMLHRAVKSGLVVIVEQLVEKGADVNAVTNEGETPLHWAATFGHVKIVQFLLSEGANINARSDAKETPLHKAADSGHGEVVELLIANGAKVNAVCEVYVCIDGTNGKLSSKQRCTPLDLAVRKDRLNIIEILLAHGIDPDFRNEFGYTLLHRAAKYEKPEIEIVEVLIRKRVNIMAVDRDGYTPLHLAAIEGHSNILNVLLKYDADPLAFSEAWFAWNRKTPLQLALEGNHQECVELIKQHIIGESFEKFLIVHRRNFGEDLMELLFSPGTNVNVLNSNGDSPLHIAARYGDLEVVEILKRLGAVSTKNNDRETPLDIARDKRNECERVERSLEEMYLAAAKPAASSLKSGLTTVRLRQFGEATAGFSYPQGRALDTEEGREVELKEFTGEERRKLPWKMMEKTKKFIIACLNAGNQGTIYFGVRDSGEIVGLELKAGDRDHISKALQAVLDDHIISDSGKMTKGGDQTCVRLMFVKVTVHRHPPRDLFVVEIEVKRDWNLCSDSVYYTKTWKPKGKGSMLQAAGAANSEGGEASASQPSDLAPISLCYKVEKDNYDDPAIRTNGCTAAVSKVTVEKQIKDPLRKRYKKWKHSQTLFGTFFR